MNTFPDEAVAQRLDWALEIALEAGRVTLDHFRCPGLAVERKQDDSPVTIADRTAEELLRTGIAQRFPEDAVLGEEFGASAGSSGYQWVLDPIDGTKSFIHGVPLYTTLVAVLENDQPFVGVIHAPALGETVYAVSGGGCSYIAQAGARPQPTHVSKVAQLNEALLLTSEVETFSTGRNPDALDVYMQLQRAARTVRTWGDGYGYLLVATGRADVMIDPEMDLWDTAALLPIIEEAGGRFTDWQGERTVHSRDSIATNGLLSQAVLAMTRGK